MPQPTRPQDDPGLPEPEIPGQGRADAEGVLWPGPEYDSQVERLRGAIGETVYLAELDATAVQLGARITDRPYTLLAVMDFPRPDPSTGLAPHMVVLDDGRGVNLGRIARISLRSAFSPTPDEILFEDPGTLQTLLFQERQLTPERIAQRSRQVLGEVLGARPISGGTRLAGPDAPVDSAEGA